MSRVHTNLASALALAVAACGAGIAETPAGFVDAATVVSDLKSDIRYYGDHNFVGEPIDGYVAPKCLLTVEAATALGAVQRDLAVTGLGLKVFDCYRPARAVGHFVRWAKDLDDTKMKSEFYPDVDKSELFEKGYIAERSGHSRGSTVDLTIIDLKSGEELDMGAGYDYFDPLSWPSDMRPTAEQRSNRALLRSVMLANGFKPLKEEWWHFTLKNEPYTDTYFEFEVK